MLVDRDALKGAPRGALEKNRIIIVEGIFLPVLKLEGK